MTPKCARDTLRLCVATVWCICAATPAAQAAASAPNVAPSDHAGLVEAIQEDFNDGSADDWEEVWRTWEVIDGEYRTFREHSLARTVVGDAAWTDYAVEVRLKIDRFDPRVDYGAIGLLAMYQDNDHYYVFGFDRAAESPDAPLELRIKRKWHNPQTGQVENTTLASAPYDFKQGRWYTLTASILDGELSLSVDGKSMLQVQNADLKHGQPGFLSVYADCAFDDFRLLMRTKPEACSPKPPVASVPFDGTLVAMYDFESGDRAGYRMINGALKVSPDNHGNPVLRGSLHHNLSRAVFDAPALADSKIEATGRVVHWNLENHGFRWFGLLARYVDPNNYYEFIYDDVRRELLIRKTIDGVAEVLASAPFEVALKEKYRLAAVLEGTSLRFFVDGVERVSAHDAALTAGQAGVIDVFGDVRVDDVLVFRKDPAQVAESGGLQPGDVFRDYKWTGPFYNDDHYLRVNNPESRLGFALHYMIPVTDPADPSKIVGYRNPINEIEIGDLDQATHVELVLEAWGGHTGTIGKMVRVNGNDWISIETPNTVGAGEYIKEAYDHFYYPTVRIPLEHLREGVNTFEFKSGPQAALSFGWGQWGVFGAIFRVHYSDDKPHVRGQIALGGSSITDDAELGVRIANDANRVRRVDYIACYEDFDNDGDGIYREWQYYYHRGELAGHAASTTEAPFSATWDTRWTPDQQHPIKIMALITDQDGVTYVTPAAEGLELARTNYSVKLYKPFDVPAGWQTRGNTALSNAVIVNDDLSIAAEAQLLIRHYNGMEGTEVGINGRPVAGQLGYLGGFKFDTIPVPTDYIQYGENRLYTLARTADHGIGVMWPGMALKVRYEME